MRREGKEREGKGGFSAVWGRVIFYIFSRKGGIGFLLLFELGGLVCVFGSKNGFCMVWMKGLVYFLVYLSG